MTRVREHSVGQRWWTAVTVAVLIITGVIVLFSSESRTPAPVAPSASVEKF
jgi:hypothetical protein